MSIPASGPVSLNDVLAEFNAPAKTPMSSLLAGGEYVPSDAIFGFPENFPLAISDFRGIDLDPNPVTLNNITLKDDQIKIVAATRRGLLVEEYSGSGVVPDEAKFVMDVKARLGPNAVDGNNRGVYWLGSTTFTNATTILEIAVGFTLLDPEDFDDATLLANAYYSKIKFVRCDQNYGYAEHSIGGSIAALYDTSGSDYSSNVRPSKSRDIHLRITRGEFATSGKLGLKVYIYDKNGWSVLWKSSERVGSSGPASIANFGGYVFIGSTGPDLTVTQVKLETGTTTPSW